DALPIYEGPSEKYLGIRLVCSDRHDSAEKTGWILVTSGNLLAMTDPQLPSHEELQAVCKALEARLRTLHPELPKDIGKWRWEQGGPELPRESEGALLSEFFATTLATLGYSIFESAPKVAARAKDIKRLAKELANEVAALVKEHTEAGNDTDRGIPPQIADMPRVSGDILNAVSWIESAIGQVGPYRAITRASDWKSFRKEAITRLVDFGIEKDAAHDYFPSTISAETQRKQKRKFH